jgi:hypothetical protein
VFGGVDVNRKLSQGMFSVGNVTHGTNVRWFISQSACSISSDVQISAIYSNFKFKVCDNIILEMSLQ